MEGWAGAEVKVKMAGEGRVPATCRFLPDLDIISPSLTRQPVYLLPMLLCAALPSTQIQYTATAHQLPNRASCAVVWSGFSLTTWPLVELSMAGTCTRSCHFALALTLAGLLGRQGTGDRTHRKNRAGHVPL